MMVPEPTEVMYEAARYEWIGHPGDFFPNRMNATLRAAFAAAPPEWLEAVARANRGGSMNIPDGMVEALRDAEWAYSCSPKRPSRDGVEWARWRLETVLAWCRDEPEGQSFLLRAALTEEEVHWLVFALEELFPGSSAPMLQAASYASVSGKLSRALRGGEET